MLIAGFSFLVLGITFLICYPINKRKNSRCSAQAQGVLRNIHQRFTSRGPAGYKYVYSYFVDGVEYQITSPNLSPEANVVGDLCTIWYNPAKPKDAQPFHYSSNNPYTIVLILGIAMVVLGLVLSCIGLSQL